MEAVQAAVRAEIDHRLYESGRARRTDLGLEGLVAEFHLDEVERATIVLALVPALGSDLSVVLGDLVVTVGSTWNAPSPALIAVFCELDLAGRIDLHRRFSAGGKLIRAGLVRFEYNPMDDIESFATANLHIQPTAFRHVVGLEPEDDPNCLCCGQPIRSPWARSQ